MTTYLVKAVLASVTDINDLDNLGSQSTIEHVTLTKLGLEVRASRQNKTGDVDLVIGDKVLNSMFSDLADIVVSLFVTKTRETESRLTTTAVLLGEIDSKFVDDFTRVASESAKKGAVTIHDDETEPGI